MLKAHIVYLPEESKDALLALLQAQLLPGIAVTIGEELPEPADFQVLVTGRPTREHLAASPNLRVLIIPWAGLPEETHELMADFPQVSVHNLHHNEAPTAEMAIALLLAAARFVVPMDQALRRNDWTLRYDPPPVVVLDGGTALILGYGAIGQRVARACQALGMRILATRRDLAAPAPADIAAEIYPPEALPELLSRANALIITLPLTEETRGLIGAEELALLPRGSLLVNIGRGPIVDEEALYDALKAGHLAAAGSDVWYNYPKGRETRRNTPPSRFPFHELDNMVLSPHRGGALKSDYTERARMEHLARLLNAVAQGQPAPNRIDLARGY